MKVTKPKSPFVAIGQAGWTMVAHLEIDTLEAWAKASTQLGCDPIGQSPNGILLSELANMDFSREGEGLPGYHPP